MIPHIKEHIASNLIPHRGSSTYTPTARIPSNFTTGWEVNAGVPYFSIAADVATNLLLQTSNAHTEGTWFDFGSYAPAGSSVSFSCRVLDSVGGLGGIRIWLFDGATPRQLIVSVSSATNSTVYSFNGTSTFQVNRLVIFGSLLASAPGIALDQVSITI